MPRATESLQALAKKVSTTAEDLEWVYKNLAVEKPVKRHCPSAGALGMWEWARENRNAFYAAYMRHMAKQEDATEKEIAKDADMRAAEITRMLKPLLGCSESETPEHGSS